MLDFLKDVQPGDLEVAADAALKMGKKFMQQLNTAANLLHDEPRAVVRNAITPTAVAAPAPEPQPNG